MYFSIISSNGNLAIVRTKTKVAPSIYNSPYLRQPMPEEYLLRDAKPLDHKTEIATLEKLDAPCVSYDLPKTKVLPPLSHKQQGPFREPADVQNQRFKPFQPTLRVESVFYSVQAARKSLKARRKLYGIRD